MWSNCIFSISYAALFVYLVRKVNNSPVYIYLNQKKNSTSIKSSIFYDIFINIFYVEVGWVACCESFFKFFFILHSFVSWVFCVWGERLKHTKIITRKKKDEERIITSTKRNNNGSDHGNIFIFDCDFSSFFYTSTSTYMLLSCLVSRFVQICSFFRVFL
jgi:hypothetical protein